MNTPYAYQLRHDQSGLIIEKTETVGGEPVIWNYTYDNKGHLHEAHMDGRLVCQCDYDREGRRSRDYFPATVGPHYRNYQYTMDNRLLRAGNNTYTHDDSGFRSIWSCGGTYYMYEYSPDYRLLKMEVENGDRVYTYSHDENGQRIAKHLNGQVVEGYQWLDFVRLAGFHDGDSSFEFAYNEDERTPYAMRRDDGAIAYLFYDQVGSLRVVADLSGNVIKEVLYDPFGSIIKDTNPDLLIPIGFSGGLHDRDLGFVRYGWRDYDTYTGRWTAPDPIGDRGGDPDWYRYCLNDPVNGVDTLGLFLSWVFKQGLKQGIKKTGQKAAKENPENSFLEGVDRFLNGKRLDKDPKGSDSDNDGIPDYYDYDSDWKQNPEKLEKEREEYHKIRNKNKGTNNYRR